MPYGRKRETWASAEARLGGGGLAGVGSAEVHVQFRLLIGDVFAGHGELFSGVENPAIPTRVTESQVPPPVGGGVDAGVSLRSGYARPPADPSVIHPD